MSPLRFGLLQLTLSLAAASSAVAQPAAECPLSECAPATSASSPRHAQLRAEAAATHQLKLPFVDAIQRLTRAQAGTFGDEGAELTGALTAMRAALSRWDLAITQFEARAARVPADAERHVIVAMVLLNRQRIDDALRELNAAERLDNSRADVHALKGLAYSAINRPDDAVRELRKASAIEPDNPARSYALAQQLTLAKRGDEAVEVLRGVARALQRRSPTRRSADAPGGPFERIDLLRQAAGTAPIFPQGRYVTGFAALGTGAYERAVTTLADAAAGDPLVTASVENRERVVRAASALREGRVDAAIQQLELGTQTSPDDAEMHRLLGLTYWIDEQPGKSLEHFRSAIRLAPDDERARVTLSDVLMGERRFAEAERELTTAIDAGPPSGQIRYRLAQLYQRQSLLPPAATAFLDSSTHGPFVGRDRFYLEWGSLLVNQADFDGAIAAYSRRVAVNPNSAEAHRQLGDIFFLQGRHDEALAEFSVAAWLDPTDARAHAGAGQVHLRMAQVSGRDRCASAVARARWEPERSALRARHGFGTKRQHGRGKASAGRIRAPAG